MFSLITGRHIGEPHGISIQIYFYIFKLHEMLPQITQKWCTAQTWESDTEVVKRFVSYNIPSSSPLSLNDFEFIFFVAWQWKYLQFQIKNKAGFDDHSAHLNSSIRALLTTTPCTFDHHLLCFEQKCVLLPIRELPPFVHFRLTHWSSNNSPQ